MRIESKVLLTECVFYSQVNTQNFITTLSQQMDCTVITPKIECIIKSNKRKMRLHPPYCLSAKVLI